MGAGSSKDGVSPLFRPETSKSTFSAGGGVAGAGVGVAVVGIGVAGVLALAVNVLGAVRGTLGC